MKKEILIMFFIISFILIINAATQIYTNNFFDSVSSDINYIEEKILNEDNDDLEQSYLKEKIENVIEKWNDKYKYFACFVEHDELEKVKTQLISIRANILVGNYEKTVDEIERCKFILQHIVDKDSLKIVNIF